MDKSQAPHPTICRVAIDTPLRLTFDYRIAPDSEAPALGCRVAVPFGRRQLVGVAVGLGSTSDIDESKLKTISKILDSVPVFDAPLLQLLRWAADYYHHPIGEVIAAALPKLMREGASLVSHTECWRATDAGTAALGAG